MCENFQVTVMGGWVVTINVPSATPTFVVVRLIEDIEAVVQGLQDDPPRGGMS